MPPPDGGDLGDIEALFNRVVDTTEEVRERLLAAARRERPGLAAAVEELLEAHDAPDDRLEAHTDGRGPVFDALEATRSRDWLGKRVGPFELVDVLGEGGMATVYRGVRETDDFRQQVAVKILRGGRVTEEGMARFARERRIVAALDHPGIAHLIDGGVTAAGRPWVALELVDGRPIDRYCDEEGLGVAERLRLLIEVGRALHYAHQNLVVHRDLKPSNIFVDGTGRVRLLDFGIAKELGPDVPASDLTRAEALPMTPLYASPEQLTGAQITTLSDQYQLGLVLFELVTGQCHHLLDGSDPKNILARATERPTPRPSEVLQSRSTMTGSRRQTTRDRVARIRRTSVRELVLEVRGDLDWIVLEALDKDPSARYASVAALVEDLERLLAGHPIQARPPSVAYQARKWIGRHRGQALLATALALALAGFVVTSRIQSRRADRVRAFSQQVEREAEQIERLLHDATLRPVHDMTPERREVAARIERLARAGAEAPKLLGPAADYGMGRGLLALGDVDGAAAALERAWEHGFRGDGIRSALGITLGRLYRRQLRAAGGIDDETLRKSRLLEAREIYRDRALEHLAAIANEEQTELNAALIAFYEGDYQRALEGVARARERYPWRHEALAMEAEILIERGSNRHLLGDADGARADLRRAGDLLEEALEIGPSDAELYLRQCQMGATTLRMLSASGELERHVWASRRSCEWAGGVRPDWAEPWVALADLYLALWNVRSTSTSDLEEVVSPMRRAAERALELDPEHAAAHHRLGLSYFMEGREASRSGASPLAIFDRAGAALERSIELDPGYPYSYNGLALVANESAFWLLRHGRDPTSWVGRAKENARRAVELVPFWHNARLNLSNAWSLEASWRYFNGRDPTRPTRRALAEIDRVLETNPEFHRARRLRLQPLQDMIFVRLESGEEPIDELQELRRDIQILNDALPPSGFVAVATIRGEMAAAWPDPGRAAVPDHLLRARQATELGRRLAPRLYFDALAIEVELLAARHAFLRGASLEAALGRAEAIGAGLGDPVDGDALLYKAMAATRRLRAAVRLLGGENPSAEVTAGMAVAEIGLERNPLYWGTAAERSALTLLLAIHEDNETLLLARARSELHAILEANPLVTATVEPLLEVADRLADGSLSKADAVAELILFRGAFPRR